jgi:hypothetical protein
MAGVNMSDDLAAPSRSIPLGESARQQLLQGRKERPRPNAFSQSPEIRSKGVAAPARLSAVGISLLLWITGRPIPEPTRGWVLRAGCATPAWGD